MGLQPNWTAEELEYLENKWGSASLKAISNHLNRSINAVKCKAHRIGLRNCRETGDLITVFRFAKIIHEDYAIIIRWIKKFDFPARQKIFIEKKREWVLTISDFWPWAKDHKHLINFYQIEPLILGREPGWVAEQRKIDHYNLQKARKKFWSREDVDLLRSLVKLQKYSYPEIASILKRTESAIKRKLIELGIKDRPVYLDNHRQWTSEDVALMLELLQKGYGLNTIATKLGRSELGIRGKLERLSELPYEEAE